MKQRVLIILGFVLSAAILAACGSSDSSSSDSGNADSGSPETIKIGYSGDFSGLLAAYDVPARNGAEFAADEINASGGPYKVDLAVADNKGDTKLTVTQTQEFLDEGRLIEVIGTGEGRTAAASLVGESGGVPLATLNGYPTFIDEGGPNSVMLVVLDNIQAAAAAEYACDQGYKTVYTFSSDDFAYLKYQPVYFADAFAEICGGEVIGNGEFALGQTDFAALITALKNVNPQPDAIYTSMFVPDSVAFAKQLRQAGVELPYLSSDANYLQDFVDSAGASADGVVNSTFGFLAPGTPLQEFQDDYEKATGEAPATPVYEAIGRDQIYGMVRAAELAGSTDPDAILGELANVPQDAYVALQGATMDPETHSPDTAQITMVAIENGQFKDVGEITPDYVPEPVR